MSFEENLKRLEKIVDELHSEKLPLEKSLEKFEEGVKLADASLKMLESMKKKIEVISKTKDGKIKISPFKEE
jgi:exodeoxyribonuclease VII small subunit